MTWELSAVAAITPALLLVWYFHKRDIYPEPPRVLWATFFLGVLCALPAILIAMPFYFLGQLTLTMLPGLAGVLLAGLINAFLSAGMCEEACKLGVLMRYSFRRREFDELMDGIVYGAVASLGFAAIENVLYAIKGGVSGSVMRAFTAIPMHACVGAIMGAYLGRARFDPLRRTQLILTGYLIAVLLHGLYDFPLLALRHYIETTGGDEQEIGPFAVLPLLAAMAVLAVAVGWTVKLVRTARREQEHRRMTAWLAATAPVVPGVGATMPEAAAGTLPVGFGSLPPPLPYARAHDEGAAMPPLNLESLPVRTLPPYSTTLPVKRSRTIPATLTAIGAVLACWGGGITLAALVRVCRGELTDEDWQRLSFYGSLLGLLPGLIGVLCFSNGIRRLNTNPT